MKIPKVKINIDDAATLMLFSFRYVLGRATYAPSLWVDMYHTIFPQLSEDQQNHLNDRLKSELEQAIRLEEISGHGLGMDCDSQMWRNFYDEITKEKTNEAKESL